MRPAKPIARPLLRLQWHAFASLAAHKDQIHCCPLDIPYVTLQTLETCSSYPLIMYRLKRKKICFFFISNTMVSRRSTYQRNRLHVFRQNHGKSDQVHDTIVPHKPVTFLVHSQARPMTQPNPQHLVSPVRSHFVVGQSV